MNTHELIEGVGDIARRVGLAEDYNPQLLDPALLTFQEYHDLVNATNKCHPNSAYDTDVERLSSYNQKSDYAKLLQQIRRNGLKFEIRLKLEKIGRRVKIDPSTMEVEQIAGDVQYYTDAECVQRGWPLQDWSLGAFEGHHCVATVQDEYGCVLVMVAREYRGFGLGPILVKVARSIAPAKPSGGFTPSGYRNFQKVHAEFVRDALRNGVYTQLVRQRSMSLARVKEIIGSVTPRSTPKLAIDYDADDPKDYLLYVGEYGDFILYNKKLVGLLQEGDQAEYFRDRMMKGMAYVSIQGHREVYGMLRVFGGATASIRRLLMNCAIEYCRRANVPIFLEEREPNDVDPSMAEVERDSSVQPGFRAYRAIPTGKQFAYDGLGRSEARWRRGFDRYDEFKHALIEMAYAKYR